MRLNDVREWDHQTWTQLYEAALFERDKVKLCALLWSAQLAILGREQEIQNISAADQQEAIALKKALGILGDLGQLSGLDDPTRKMMAIARTNTTGIPRLRPRARSSRRSNRDLAT